jgi:hypothetical protein
MLVAVVHFTRRHRRRPVGGNGIAELHSIFHELRAAFSAFRQTLISKLPALRSHIVETGASKRWRR